MEYWLESLKNPSYPVVIYFHGNMGTRASGHRTELYRLLQAENCHVLALDYRGYGDSSVVSPLTEGALVEDAIALFRWTTKHAALNVPIFIWGHSLGTGLK